MKRYILVAFLYFLITASFGQTKKIDSLKRSVKMAANATDRLKAMLSLLDESDTLPEDTLWNYALKAKVISRQLKNAQAYSLAALAQGQAYLRWDNADSAKAIIEPELVKYRAEDPASRDIYFKLAQTRFACVANNSNYKNAMPFIYDVMRKAELYKDSAVIANCMNTLAAWNYDMDFLALSRTWDYKALSYIRANDPRYYPVLIGIYVTLGDNYRWIKNTDSASYFMTRAISLSQKTQRLFWLSSALQRMSAIYVQKKNYTKAERSILESLRIIQLVEGKAPQPDLLMFLASVYEHSGQLDKAIQVLNDGLASDTLYRTKSPHALKTSKSTDLSEVFYNQELAKCYRLKGDFKQYSVTLEKIITGKDAFFKANSAEAIAELETKYEVQKKEATIARQKLILAKDGYFFWGAVSFTIFGAVIIWLIFRDYRRKQTIRMQLLHEEEKRRGMQAVAEAEEQERRRIAADLHDNLGAQLSFIKRNVNYIMDQPEGFSQQDERKYLTYVNDTAQNAMIDLRETIWVLNKDAVSIQEFADKLKSYLRQQLLDKDMIRWDFNENIGQSWMLPSGEVMHLFRIVQEIISNIIKHAGGGRVNIELSSTMSNTYQLIITDNGKGFKIDHRYEGHYGLENIQRRAKEINAELIFESEPGAGTKVVLYKGKYNPFALFNAGITTANFTG